jgi:hypothetical protein
MAESEPKLRAAALAATHASLPTRSRAGAMKRCSTRSYPGASGREDGPIVGAQA